MRKHFLRICLVAFIILSAGTDADAQFLNKISKGLEKVNKGLEKADNALNSDRNNTVSNSVAAETKINEADWKLEKNGTRYPYITAETKFMLADPSEYSISGVYDGVFAVKKGNNWEFWRVDGQKLFDADWEYCNGGFAGIPKFSSGVLAAKKSTANDMGKKPICLLYLDGAVKELSPDYAMVTQFMDGIALVEAKINYKTQYFYINTSGEKMYPNLSVGIDGNFPIRPLKNDLRGYFDRTARKWGFIDMKGNVKIHPKYSDVSNFSEGYAWGTVNESPSYKELIDATGKSIYRTESSYTKVSDVVDGRYYVIMNNKVCYYDVNTLKEVASYNSGNCFYGGYAFVYNDEFRHDYCSLVDKDMREVSKISANIMPPSIISEFGPVFEPFGLASVRSIMGYGDYVITPKGGVLIHAYDSLKGTFIKGFRQFTADGYMQATNTQLFGKRALALVKPSGEIAWLFSKDNEVGGPLEYNPLPPTDSIPRIGPPYPRLPEPGGPAIGPKIITRTQFTVNVIASPAEGGSASISPSGKFNYGENAVLAASPNKDWAVGYITTDLDVKAAPQPGKPFTVTTDQTITVHFIKKEDETEPDKYGIYQGTAAVVGNPVTVYAEINHIGTDENPYGSNNYGFVVMMFDPNKRYYTPANDVSANFFAVPLKIAGMQKDKDNPEKRWLVMDGGSLTCKDIKVSPKNDNPFAHLYFNLCIGFDGFTTVNTAPRRYRVEVTDYNEETGEFTFGELQTYSPTAGGYVNSEDPSLRKVTQGFFANMTDKGYSSATFYGTKMKPGSKRDDVLWYPGESWSKDKSAHETLVEAMRRAYKSAKSDYEQLFY